MIVNLTHHPLVINGVEIPPDGRVATLVEHTVRLIGVDHFQGAVLPVALMRVSGVQGLPEPQFGVRFVVSRVLAQVVPEREDLLIPGTKIRDWSGRIVAASSLARIPRDDDPW